MQSKTGVINGAEVDVFLEISCFFCDPVDVGNLISGCSAFSKSSLYIWKFLVHMLLKLILKEFEYYLVGMWNECSFVVIWTFFGIALLLKCSTFIASSFRIWNSSAGIPSPPLALFVVMLPKAHLTSPSRMSGSRWVITPSWLSGLSRSFFVQFFCVSLPSLLNIFSFC